ncbi:LacI family DNA-binding transcriptional regulator [Pantoea dispersa]|uniref:LacI family DNA-binding transcriptional regulator n=1 Tax=Pantoea TaxID=53335 RepID=UPI000736018A|nr:MULTISPECIES: LacI family DNA-binding transcriptional regulator [Pantoea]KAA6098876.1 LacI family transcriptional regulator [Pantoea sp. B_9]KTS35658.1 LacI family transcriptional regulator [Pantoea dispersa]KTS61396.1 LacI family transcriptional regulator [Pantoea dispersa]MBS0904841.1 LacI family DNA-binding transcriptional regulator [Pantoea dispersa]
MSKITMSAIAAAAGVGIATVDRVLNRRAPVRAQTEQKVLAAAHRLGYRSSHAPLSTQSDGVTLRMGFILLSASYSFYQTLTDALRQQTQPFHPAGSEPLFVWHEIDEVAAVVDSLYRLAEQVEAIGVVALDHPLIRHAIAHVSRQGVRVYALFSDFSPCGHAGYFGLDNQKAGRSAGWIASHLLHQPGPAGVLLGDHRFICQENCESGFRSYLREQDSARRVLEPLKTHESIAGGYQATRQLLEQHADLALIYAPCGGIEGVVQALREQPQRKVALICHGPVNDGDLALIDGTITVMLRHQIADMARQLAQTVLQRHAERSDHFSQVTLPFEIVMRENV